MISPAGSSSRLLCSLLAVIVLSLAVGIAADGDQPSAELETRVFDVGPDLFTRLDEVIGIAHGESSHREGEQSTLRPRWGLQEALVAMGIPFEEGAHCVYRFSDGTLTVTNTAEQLGLIAVYLSMLDDQRERQIQVIFEMVEVDHAEFSDWLFDHHIDKDGTPLRRWAQEKIRKGKAAIIETAMVTCRSGQRARASSGSEYIYPTEYDPPEIPNKVKLSGGAKAPETGVNPTAFETRHVGTTLEVDSVLGPDNVSIDLNLAPEVVRLDGHVAWPNDDVEAKLQARMPIFFKMKITTQVTLLDGGYAFLGTMRPRQASVEGVEEPIVLAFVRGDVGVLPWPKPRKKALNKQEGEK